MLSHPQFFNEHTLVDYVVSGQVPPIPDTDTDPIVVPPQQPQPRLQFLSGDFGTYCDSLTKAIYKCITDLAESLSSDSPTGMLIKKKFFFIVHPAHMNV